MAVAWADGAEESGKLYENFTAAIGSARDGKLDELMRRLRGISGRNRAAPARAPVYGGAHLFQAGTARRLGDWRSRPWRVRAACVYLRVPWDCPS